MSVERLHAAIERHREVSALVHAATVGINNAQRFDSEMEGYFRLALERGLEIKREIETEFADMLDK